MMTAVGIAIGVLIVFLFMRLEHVPRESDEGAAFYLGGYPGLGRDYIPGRFVFSPTTLTFTPEAAGKPKLEFPVASIAQVRFLDSTEANRIFGLTGVLRGGPAGSFLSLPLGTRYYLEMQYRDTSGQAGKVYFSLPRNTLLMPTFRKNFQCV